MKNLSQEVTNLLDKLYNLRSSDSYILVEMEKEKEEAELTKEKTTKEKEELQEKISVLQEKESLLADEGAKLREALSGIDPEEFKNVLQSLNIDFNPVAIKEKVDELLPGKIEEVVNETKKAEDELVKVEEEMNSAVTKIDELAIRKDTELANQEKLNEYFDLALSGNINITRDAITSLVKQFNFTDEEQREAAKLMMFPEDALYDYEAKFQETNNVGKSISDVLIEAKESVTKPIGDIFQNYNSVENDDNNNLFEESKEELNLETSEEENNVASENIIEGSSISELLNLSEEETLSFINSINKELDNEEKNTLSNEEDYSIEVTTNDVDNSQNDVDTKEDEIKEESMMDLFKRIGLSEIMFAESELNDLINLEDNDLVEKNVNILNKFNINLDILSDNVNLLSDNELEEKINMILDNGKTVDDIYFNPSVLKKYNLKELESAIILLKQNGLDPKKVPLMAY